jgi:hypothetical protein
MKMKIWKEKLKKEKKIAKGKGISDVSVARRRDMKQMIAREIQILEP